MTKPVTKQALEFWIIELLGEGMQWFDIEKFFMRELRAGFLGYPDINRARQLYRQIRSRCPATNGETQKRSA